MVEQPVTVDDLIQQFIDLLRAFFTVPVQEEEK